MSEVQSYLRPHLSLVVPLFNEESVIEHLVERIRSAFSSLNATYEVILVNDGSTDETGSLIDRIALLNSCFIGVHLSRNFGHQAAVSAGLSTASGEFVGIIDGDLQDPPELIPKFLEKAREGYDVVYAIRKNRKEGLLLRTAYALFYRCLRLLSPIPIPLDSGDFCLMSRKVVNLINSMPERRRFIRGLRSYAGFAQTGIHYDRDSRSAGAPKYTFKKLIALAADGIFSFSSRPLKLATFLGSLSIIVAILYTVRTIVWRFFSDDQLPGFATIVIIILYFGSVQLFCIGILGEYIARIYDEVKGRPGFVIERVSRGEMSSRPGLEKTVA
jgi:dolichol-phosphate mannosyltransferase